VQKSPRRSPPPGAAGRRPAGASAGPGGSVEEEVLEGRGGTPPTPSGTPPLLDPLEGAGGSWQKETVSALRLAHQAHQQLEEREARTSTELHRVLAELAQARLAQEKTLRLWEKVTSECSESARHERCLAERLSQVEADLEVATARCQSLGADADREAHRANRVAEELEEARAEHAREAARFAQARGARLLREQALREELEAARRRASPGDASLAPVREVHGPVCQYCVWCRPEGGGGCEWWVQADGARVLLKVARGSSELDGATVEPETLRPKRGALADEPAGAPEPKVTREARCSQCDGLARELEARRSQKCGELMQELQT
ncbi:unnamed protein product, partial [Prorocentrum cordatum]